jgi:hypothetical protein
MPGPPGWIGALITLAGEIVRESIKAGVQAKEDKEYNNLLKQYKKCQKYNADLQTIIKEQNKALEEQYEDLLSTRRRRDDLYMQLMGALLQKNPRPIPTLADYDLAMAEDSASPDPEDEQ